jgi:hypothetical protein
MLIRNDILTDTWPESLGPFDNRRRPQVAVVVLTQMTQREVWELARLNGAYACFVNQHTTGNGLDKVIQRAVAFVGQMPEEKRFQPI